MKDGFRPDIEGLRAFAVVPIVLFHIEPGICPGGFAGVDIFFVISGFVISRMIVRQGEDFRLSNFYIGRFFRLTPALLVAVAATLVAAWKIVTPLQYVGLAESSLTAILAMSNIYFCLTANYFTPSALEHPLLHTWSLGVEEQFYLVWPTLLWVLRGSGALAGLCIIVAALASFGAMIFLRGYDPDLVFYMMPFRMFEFSGGALLALYSSIETHCPLWMKNVLGVVGGLLLLGSVFCLNDSMAWPNAWTLMPVAGTAMLVIAGEEGRSRGVLSFPIFRWIGRLSYSLYLVHWPVIALYREKIVVDPGLSDFAWMGAASVICAVALHYWIEVPFRLPRGQTANVRLASRYARLVVPPAAMVGVIGMAAVTIEANGFPERSEGVQAGGEALTFAGDLCNAKRSVCGFGDPDSDEIVYLMGDSHALNLLSGLDSIFRREHLKGIALYDHGCPFLSGTTRFFKGVRDERCGRNVEAAYSILQQSRRPVIIAGSFGGYRGDVALQDAIAPLVQTEDEYFEWLDHQFRRSLERINADTRSVILLLQQYNTGVELAKCTQQPGAALNKCKATTRSESLRQSQRIDRMVRRYSAEFGGVTTIDPKEAFCAQENCIVQSSGKWLFRDTNHLTNDGSSYLIDHIAGQLLKAIDPKTPTAGEY